MKKWLTSVEGKSVAFTGWLSWNTQKELQRAIIRLRATPTTRGRVSSGTDVLVRGNSSMWSHDDYGNKEQRAAELIRSGKNLVVVSDSEFRNLVEHTGWARISDVVAGQPIEWLRSPSQVEFQKVASIEGPLDRQYTARGRTEQGYLRRLLFADKEEAECALCGCVVPVSLLVAAHIKPRSECSRSERLDAKNIVFATCLLGCDALYEQGHLSLDLEGRVRCVKRP